MPSATHIVELRRLLAERFPQAHGRRPVETPAGVSTGVPALDEALGGGLVPGMISELVGDGEGSGTAQVLHALVRSVASSGRFLALVDGADSFDVDAAAPEMLARLLWVRCPDAGCALKAADLLLRDRNLPLVVLDLKMNPAGELRRVPSSLWFRFSRLVEHHGTILFVITPQALVGAADVRVRVAAGLDLAARNAGPDRVAARLRFEPLRAAAGEGAVAQSA